MRALGVTVLAAATSCAPRPAVTAAAAAAELCDGARAWPVVIDGGRVFVDARVRGASGERPVRLMVDTGGNAHGIAMFRSSANRAGFVDAAQIARELVVGDHVTPLPDAARWVVIDDTQPGSLPSRARPGESDGQIGAGFLSRFRLCFDPSSRRLGLGDRDASPISPADAGLAVDLAEEAPLGARYAFVRATAAGRPLSLLVDTGATVGMLHARDVAPLWMWPTARVAELASGDWDMVAGALADERVLSIPVAVGGGHELGPVTFVSREDATFQRLFTALPAGGPDGALGNDVWLRHRVLLDYATARLFIWRQRDAEEPAARVPVTLAFDAAGCPTVARASSELRAEGLVAGDRIEQIDGRAACGATHSTVSRWLERPHGSRATLVLKRAGHRVDAIVTSRPALVPRLGHDALAR